MYWIVIIIGILILSLSLSNPFYRLLIKRKIKFNFFAEIVFRIILFLLAIIIIFIGLYIESI